MDKIQNSETEHLRLMGEIHGRINDLEREMENKCGERREKVQEKIESIKELLYTSEGEVSKTRESMRLGLLDRIEVVNNHINHLDDNISNIDKKVAILEQKISTLIHQEEGKFGKRTTVMGIIIAVISLAVAIGAHVIHIIM